MRSVPGYSFQLTWIPRLPYIPTMIDWVRLLARL